MVGSRDFFVMLIVSWVKKWWSIRGLVVIIGKLNINIHTKRKTWLNSSLDLSLFTIRKIKAALIKVVSVPAEFYGGDLHIYTHRLLRDVSICTPVRHAPGLLVKVFIIFWGVVELVLTGSWLENSSEGGDMTKFICIQRLSKHDFPAASVKWLQKIYFNRVHQNVNVHRRANADLECVHSVYSVCCVMRKNLPSPTLPWDRH